MRQFNARSKINWNDEQAQGLQGAWPLAEGSGTVAYDLTGRNNGTLIGTPAVVPGPYGPALRFNGSGQHINIPNNTSLQIVRNLTISVWIYLTAYPTDYQGICSKFAGDPINEWNLRLHTATKAQFYFGTGPAAVVLNWNPTADIPLNQWVHLVGVRDFDAGYMTIWSNGIARESTGTGTTLAHTTTSSVMFAPQNGGTSSMVGWLADGRIYNRALSQAGIQSLYTDPLALVRLPRRTYGFLSAVPTSLTPGAGSIALTGAVPTLELDDSLTPGAGSLILTGSAPTLAAGTTLAPNSGSVVLSGHAPELTAGDSLIPIAGAITLIGQVPTLAWDSTLSPGAGSVVISGYAPTIGEGTYLDPGVGSLAFTGYPPTIRTVFARAGGVPNYQYPGEAEPFARDGTTALFDTADRAERRRRRLKESFKALGVVPPDPVPAPASRPDLPPKAPVGPSAQELARAAAADRVVADLKAAAIAAQQKAERIRLDDGDVLLLLAELV